MTKKKMSLLLASIYICLFAFAANQPKNIGVVAIVDGEVWKVADGGKGKKEFINNNSEIFEKDQIITSENGYIKILMNDDTIFDLGGASNFIFEEFKMNNKEDRTAKYDLKYGQMRSIFTVKAKKDDALQVKTPDVVMGIRGTEFLTQRTDTTKVVLLEGKINLRSIGADKSIAMEPGSLFDSSKISASLKDLNVSISKVDNIQLKEFKMNKMTDKSNFIQSVISPKEKFPVNNEMKESLKDKPAAPAVLDKKQDQKDSDFKEMKQDPRRSQLMRNQFIEQIKQIETNQEGYKPPTDTTITNPDYPNGQTTTTGGSTAGCEAGVNCY
ncbi:MAG: FecR domain-containing protein [Bacteriovoracaceae bacterium]|nr:FecR domain-containing protein [Bacteriovoracaceae bacterium]